MPMSGGTHPDADGTGDGLGQRDPGSNLQSLSDPALAPMPRVFTFPFWPETHWQKGSLLNMCGAKGWNLQTY